MKKIIFSITCIFALSACNDFLDEDYRSIASNESFYATINGLESLVTSAYVSTKIWYGKEEGFDFSDASSDMYTYGQQHPNRYQFTFGPDFNSFNGRLTVLWVEFYKGINACNEALYHLSDVNHPMSEALKQKRTAEMLFIRAHYFWLLTVQWGDVPMPLTRTNEPTITATKTPSDEIYDQILLDLNTAFDLLTDADNSIDADFGRVTRDAVRAFRARINLSMASYIKRAGNPFGLTGSANDYYTKALEDANALIPKYPLYTNYNDLWKFENNGPGSKNTEGIWAINYTRGPYAMLNINLTEYQDYFAPGQKPFDEREGGHHGHMMWGPQYDFGNGSGMVRDLFYGRRFRRYAPNKYLIDAFDETKDARFDGQFRTTWISNSTAASSSAVFPKWNEFNLPVGFTPPGAVTDPIFIKGDTALFITKKNIDDTRVVSHKTSPNRFLYLDGPYLVWDYNLLFNADGSINNTPTGDHNFFIDLKKFDDPARQAANGTGSQNGARDAYVFRVAEMYLIAAEASLELGQDAYSYLEDLATVRALPSVTGAQLLSAYGINSNADVTIDKLLDERAREFPGEQLRWQDLKRLHSPEALVTRMNLYNPDTKPQMQSFHYLRPIPQIQIDAIVNKDKFLQNEGYNGQD